MAADPLSLIPSALLAEYEPEHLIARGAFGAVFRARQSRLDRLVALKILLSADTDPEQLKRFDREARMTAQLSHPAIIRLYAHGVADGTPWIAYELVVGGSLRDRLNSGPLPLAEALAAGRQIAGGLAAAHAAGILHRDIKPDNVLVAAEGLHRIADFGVARRALDRSWHTSPGVILGTPFYLSPEAIRGEPGAACDVYALGIMLHELLSGRPPSPDGEPLTVLQWHLAPARPRLDGVPAAVAALVHKAIAREASARFASAAELEAALGEVVAAGAGPRVDTMLAATPVKRAPASRPRPAPAVEPTMIKPPPRRGALLAAALAGALGASALTALALRAKSVPTAPAPESASPIASTPVESSPGIVWQASKRLHEYRPPVDRSDFAAEAGSLDVPLPRRSLEEREAELTRTLHLKPSAQRIAAAFDVARELRARADRGESLDDGSLVQIPRSIGLAFNWEQEIERQLERPPGLPRKWRQVPAWLAFLWFEDALREILTRQLAGAPGARGWLPAVSQSLYDLGSSVPLEWPDLVMPSATAFSLNLKDIQNDLPPGDGVWLRDVIACSWKPGHGQALSENRRKAHRALDELARRWGIKYESPYWFKEP